LTIKKEDFDKSLKEVGEQIGKPFIEKSKEEKEDKKENKKKD
jgi:hypothetical protein